MTDVAREGAALWQAWIKQDQEEERAGVRDGCLFIMLVPPGGGRKRAQQDDGGGSSTPADGYGALQVMGAARVEATAAYGRAWRRFPRLETAAPALVQYFGAVGGMEDVWDSVAGHERMRS